VQRFFEDYKILEHKAVKVEGFLDRDEAQQVVREALISYQKNLYQLLKTRRG
jgi:inorganic pyrophosphatase